MTPAASSTLTDASSSARIGARHEGPSSVGPSVLAGLLATGLIFDAAATRGPATLATSALFASVSAFLLVSGRVTSRSGRTLALLAPIFGVFLLWRSSPWLVFPNVTAGSLLLAAAVVFSQRGRIWDTSLITWAATAGQSAASTIQGLPALAGRYRSRRDLLWNREGRATLTGAALATPLIIGLGALLVSGDAVFASLLTRVDMLSAARHSMLVATGACGVALLLSIAGATTKDPEPRARILRARSADVVLGALIGLYSLYAGTTAIAAFAGAGAFLDDPEAVADWARSGFFQLLAAAAITLGVLVALRAATDMRSAAEVLRFRVFSSLAILLTLLIVAGAVIRIFAYSEAYGLTMLRLYSALFACWLGFVFLFFLAATWQGERRAEWWPAAAGFTGLVVLAALNLANPEARVVTYNVNHRGEVERFDAAYLASLSDDATPALVATLDRLTPGQRETVLWSLCGRASAEGGLSWNRARGEAADARIRVCGGR